MDGEKPSTSAAQLHEPSLRRGAYVTPNVCDDGDKVQRLDKCIVIEYPGRVSNKWRAVQRLGGLAAIVERDRPKVKLQQCNLIDTEVPDADHPTVKMFPSIYVPRPLTAPAKSASQSGRIMVVVRARRRKRTEEQEPGPTQMSIVGLLHSRYEFGSMCDFAFLPYRRIDDEKADPDAPENAPPRYEDVTRKIVPVDVTSALNWWESKDGERAKDDRKQFIHAPSPLLSRYSVPSTFLLLPKANETEQGRMTLPGRGPKAQSKKSDERTNMTSVAAESTEALGLSNRPRRPALSINVDGTEENLPTAPLEAAVTEADKTVKDQSVHKAMHELFESRPLWTKSAVHFHVPSLDAATIKVMLPKFAFYISAGAFGRLWCRYGYDPRKDPESRLYQIVEARFVPLPNDDGQRTRRLAFAHAAGSSVPVKPSLLGSKERSIVLPAVDESAFRYRPGLRPVARQLWYCLCDVQLPIVEKLLAKQPKKEFDYKTGYFTARDIDSVREAIKENLKHYFEDATTFVKKRKKQTDGSDDNDNWEHSDGDE